MTAFKIMEADRYRALFICKSRDLLRCKPFRLFLFFRVGEEEPHCKRPVAPAAWKSGYP